MRNFIQRFRFLSALCLLLFATVSRGQVQVSVTVTPPYSGYAKDYIKDGSNVLITLTNLGAQAQPVKLISSLTGDNGVKIAVKETYLPVAPIVLAPHETKLITQNGLKAFNVALSEGDVQHQGINQAQLLQDGKLPEGVYQLCVKVMSYAVAAVPLGNTGCGSFSVIFYDPPIIMNPVKGALIAPQQPQLIPFSWTPSGVAGKTKYSLRIVDMTATNLFNPNDAFINENIFPFFKQDNIATNAYIYDAGKPKLTESHQYAVMIVASEPQGKLQYKNNGRSEVSTFTYKAGAALMGNNNPIVLNGNPGNGQDDPPGGPCSGNTLYGSPIDPVQKNGIPNGTDIAVGKFVMKNTKFTKSNGTYNGTGEILVNFVNAKVMVEFTGITINASNRIASGIITGKVTSNSGITQAMRSDTGTIIDKVPDMDALMVLLEKGTRQVNKLDPAKAPIDLPISFKKDDFNIGIVGIIFTPKEAFVNEVLNTPMPQIYGDDYLLLSATGVAIHPNGYGSPEMKLTLAHDQSVKLSNGVSLTFKGGADKTFATFDCGGFKAITMDGAYTFSRDLLLPVDNSGKVKGGGEQVKVAFKIAAAPKLNDLLYTGLTFSSHFAIPAAQDFIFAADGVTLDLSSGKNGADFATAYPAKGADWTGVFIKNISVTLPGYLKKNNNEKTTLALSAATADKAGFQGIFSVSGEPLTSASLAGWGLTLTKLSLNIKNSGITGGGVNGTIKLPLGDKAEVGFGATISAGGENGAIVGFGVNTLSDIEANLFLAKLKLGKNSTLGIAKNGQGIFTVTAVLNGEIGIDFSGNPGKSNVSKLNIPGLKFQEMKIVGTEGEGAPEFSLGFAQLQGMNNAQAKIAGAFEINLNSIGFAQNPQKKSEVGLSLGLGLSILGGEQQKSNGFSVTTGLTISALYDGNKRTYHYDHMHLDSISVVANMGVAALSGKIILYDADSTYGNGFRGELAAAIKGIDISVAVAAQFGRTLPSKGDYKYWYIDAMVDMGKTGIPIPGTVASFYGFGGGAWGNMARTGGSDKIAPGSYTANNKGGSAAPTRSGVKFVPSKGDAGFKAAVLFGLTGSRNAFNGDFTFTMTFNAEKLSVTGLILDGNAYLMQSPENVSKRNSDNAFVHAGGHIDINIPKRSFNALFNAEMNVAGIIKGSGILALEFDRPDEGEKGGTTKWFVKVGSWTPGADPFTDPARLTASIGFDAKVVKLDVTFQAYMMIGNDLEFGLPPLPEDIYALVKDDGAPKKKSMPEAVADNINLAFAIGAGIKLDAGFDFFILSANLEALAGFDALLANAHVTCGGKEAGFEGWYAKGQAYAMIKGDMKLFRKIPVASFMAGAVLQFMGPNPNYISGDIVAYIDIFGHEAGDYHGHFQRGQLCEGMKTEFDPFASLKLIKSTSPEKLPGGKKGVDPFAPITVKFMYHYPAIYRTNVYMYDAYNSKQVTYEFVPHIKLVDDKGYEVPVTLNAKPYHEEFVTVEHPTLDEKRTYKLIVDAYMTGPGNKGEKHEQVIAQFTTAAYPEYIHMEDLTDAYPVPMQRYAMKYNADGAPLNGRLVFNRNLDYFTKKYEKDYDIVVRFTNVATGEVEAKFHPNEFAKQLTFYMPYDLKNSTIYHVGVYLEKKAKVKGDISSLAQNSDGERVIFPGYYFRTSKYSSFKKKFNDYEVKKVGYLPEFAYATSIAYQMSDYADMGKDYYTPVMLLQGGEPLDAAEYAGYIKYGHKDLMSSEETSTWLSTMSGTYIECFHPKLSVSDRNFMANIVIVDPGIFFKENGDEWLTHTDWREPDLRAGGYLGGNEFLAKPDGPLTNAEIDAVRKKASQGGISTDALPLALAPPPKPGNGLYNADMGLNSNKKSYYALADNTYFQAVAATEQVTDKRMIAAGHNAALQWKVWNLAKVMGYPSFPKGDHYVNMYEKAQIEGQKTESTSIFKKLFYKYNPPK